MYLQQDVRFVYTECFLKYHYVTQRNSYKKRLEACTPSIDCIILKMPADNIQILTTFV